MTTGEKEREMAMSDHAKRLLHLAISLKNTEQPMEDVAHAYGEVVTQLLRENRFVTSNYKSLVSHVNAIGDKACGVEGCSWCMTGNQ